VVLGQNPWLGPPEPSCAAEYSAPCGSNLTRVGPIAESDGPTYLYVHSTAQSQNENGEDAALVPLGVVTETVYTVPVCIWLGAHADTDVALPPGITPEAGNTTLLAAD
jgi:hypothetical protein